MNHLLSRFTYANVTSTLALIFALGGATAFAASSGGASAGTTLKLCAAKKGGDLRLPAGGSCRANEQALTVGERGPKGAIGATGPAGVPGERGTQGERGPAAVNANLSSPDGRFTVSATDAGIVLSGPKGSLTFDGEEIHSNANLEITAPQRLSLSDGVALEITSGVTTTFTTGVNFAQTVGGAYSEAVGAGYSQSVGSYEQAVANGYTQLIGGAFNQAVNSTYTQEVAGAYDQSIGGSFKQQVDSTYQAQSGGTALLSGSSVRLGGTSCPAAARVGSEIDSFGRVAAAGSATKTSVC